MFSLPIRLPLPLGIYVTRIEEKYNRRMQNHCLSSSTDSLFPVHLENSEHLVRNGRVWWRGKGVDLFSNAAH